MPASTRVTSYLVDRALSPFNGFVIVAVAGGEFTCKRLHKRGGIIKLHAPNPTFPYSCADGPTIELWSVVTKVI